MDHDEIKNFWKNPLVLICIVAIGYWVYTYHLEHALGFLPYGILLLCPLMHIFMHNGHGHGGQGSKQAHNKSSVECENDRKRENQNAR